MASEASAGGAASTTSPENPISAGPISPYTDPTRAATHASTILDGKLPIQKALILVESSGALALSRRGTDRSLDLNKNLINALKWVMKDGCHPGMVDIVVLGDDDVSQVPEDKRASAWTPVTDPRTERCFYANRFTKATTWTSPYELQTEDWVEHEDNDAHKYYVNKTTHKSVWEKPAGFFEGATRAPGAQIELLKQNQVKVMNIKDLPTEFYAGFDMAVKEYLKVNANAVTTCFVICNDKHSVKEVTDFYQKKLVPAIDKTIGAGKASGLDSLNVLRIRNDYPSKVKLYAREIMDKLIMTRCYPAINDLIKWDIGDGYDYKGFKLESSWQNTQKKTIDRDGVEHTNGVKHNYKLLMDSLGQGAFGKVFRACDDTGRQVACKLYIKSEIDKQDMTFAVTKEIAIMCKLNAPDPDDSPGDKNVLASVENFENKEHIFVIMEIAEGGAFFDKVNQQIVDNGGFTEDSARPYFKQLIHGLRYMHDLKYVHRDLKPENMLLGGPKNQTIKLCDFGLSTWVKEDKQLMGDEAKHYTGTNSTGAAAGGAKKGSSFSFRGLFGLGSKKGAKGAKGRRLSVQTDVSNKAFQMLKSRVGTPHYVAPEVLTGAGYDGFEADVWSSGVILYILLVGSFPFDKAIIEDFIGCIRDQRQFDVQSTFALDPEFISKMSADARDLLEHMLQTDPKKRISLNEVMAHPWTRVGGKTRRSGMLHKPRNFGSSHYYCELGQGKFCYWDTDAKKNLHHALHIGECDLIEGASNSDLSFTLVDRHDQNKQYKFVAPNLDCRKAWCSDISEEAMGDGSSGKKRLLKTKKEESMGSKNMEATLELADKLYKDGALTEAEYEEMRATAMALVSMA